MAQRRQPLLVERVDHVRAVSSPAAPSRAIAGTSVPGADTMMIIARRTRTAPCFPAARSAAAARRARLGR